MTKSVLATYPHLPNVTMLPEMYVRAADTGRSDVDEAIVRSWLRYVGVYEMQGVFRIGMDGEVARLAFDDGFMWGSFAGGTHNAVSVEPYWFLRSEVSM